MATMQRYPRQVDTDLLDESSLVPHTHKIPYEDLEDIIISSIEAADRKSRRMILNLSEDATEEEIQKTYENEGWELFKYFVQYYGDPASTAYQCLGKNCYEVAIEQFRNRTLQKERMNSAWRYQFIAKDAAVASRRFDSVSDIGLSEADFNVVVRYRDSQARLAIYVSVKNRSNTMGGQDWPKAIEALEKQAIMDKNRDGDYLCVFGITIEKGLRTIRRSQKTKNAYSSNTELWFSDFFWPFFSNYSYEEIAKLVLSVLIKTQKSQIQAIEEVPEPVLLSFEKYCRESDLLDEDGCFNDSFKLVELFCRKTKRRKKSTPIKNK